MFNRFTRTARAVVLAAVAEAERRGDGYVGTEHLLVGVVMAATPQVRAAVGLTDDQVRTGLDWLDRAALASTGISVEGIAGEGPPVRRGRRRHRPFTDGAKTMLEGALHEALRLGDRHLGPEHILLAITRLPGRDTASRLLEHLSVSPERLRADLLRTLHRSA